MEKRYPKLRIEEEDNVCVVEENTLILDPPPLPVRGGGEFARRSFYLNLDYDWHIGYDGHNRLILLPTKKQEE